MRSLMVDQKEYDTMDRRHPTIHFLDTCSDQYHCGDVHQPDITHSYGASQMPSVCGVGGEDTKVTANAQVRRVFPAIDGTNHGIAFTDVKVIPGLDCFILAVKLLEKGGCKLGPNLEYLELKNGARLKIERIGGFPAIRSLAWPGMYTGARLQKQH
jgi:hypothetical protein